MYNSTKRSAIVTPIRNIEPRSEVKCQLCNLKNLDRWASTICTYCDLFICKEHMKVIADNSYCSNCINNPQYKSILMASELVETKQKKNKWSCLY